jgi:hypothetical protein
VSGIKYISSAWSTALTYEYSELAHWFLEHLLAGHFFRNQRTGVAIRGTNAALAILEARDDRTR